MARLSFAPVLHPFHRGAGGGLHLSRGIRPPRRESVGRGNITCHWHLRGVEFVGFGGSLLAQRSDRLQAPDRGRCSLDDRHAVRNDLGLSVGRIVSLLYLAVADRLDLSKLLPLLG